jgi:hypothetical protein
LKTQGNTGEKAMWHPGKITVVSFGVAFVGALFIEVAANPAGAHDTIPKAAFALSSGSGTTTMSSVAVTSISGLPISNTVTDDEHTAFFPSALPTVGEPVGLPLVKRNGAWRLLVADT